MDSRTRKDDAGFEFQVSDTRTRLGTALLGYVLAVTLVVTLLPFQFAWPQYWHMRIGYEPYDMVLNVFLFMPLGFLYRMVTPHGWSAMALVVVKAALISVAIEAVQLFDPTREATVLDVVTSTFGALVGAAAFDRIARSARLRGRILGWLGLEIPLMGLVYMLVPLLWVNTLAARGELVPTLGTFLIGAFGAVLLGGLQREYFGPLRAAAPDRTAGFAALWFVAGAFAMLPWRPFELAGGACVIAVLCGWLGRRSSSAPGANRRFEAALLRAAAPLYAAYLALLIISPVVDATVEWHGDLGFPAIGASRVETARLLEVCAAFTLLGYMVAESRGREVVRYRNVLRYLVAWAVALAVATETARGFGLHGASLARGGLLVAACFYGGWLYYLQRAHVIWLVSRPAGAK